MDLKHVRAGGRVAGRDAAAAGNPHPHTVAAAGAVKLKIGALALDGLAPGHRAALGPAVERELAALVARHGLPAGIAARGGAVPGGRFRVSPGASAGAAAAQVARQLFERMRGGAR